MKEFNEGQSKIISILKNKALWEDKGNQGNSERTEKLKKIILKFS